MDARLSRLIAAFAALSGTLAQADEPQQQQRAIVMQRLPDGSILLTDRPQNNATTERRWQVPAAAPEDAASAAERRAKAAADTAAINDRFARQLEQQRERDAALEIERQRANAAAAEREANRQAIQGTTEPSYYDYGYGYGAPGYWPPQHVRPPRPVRPVPTPHYTYQPPPPALPTITQKPRSDLEPTRPAPPPRP